MVHASNQQHSGGKGSVKVSLVYIVTLYQQRNSLVAIQRLGVKQANRTKSAYYHMYETRSVSVEIVNQQMFVGLHNGALDVDSWEQKDRTFLP